MPAPLPFAPWIKAADPAAEYGTGYHLGTSDASIQDKLQSSMQRLQQQEEIAQMRFQTQQQIADQKAEIDSQKNEVMKQYHQQQTALNMQKLEESKQLMEARTKSFAATAAARMEYEQGAKSIDNNPDLSDLQKQQAKQSLYGRLGPLFAGAGFGTGYNAMAPPVQAGPPNIVKQDGYDLLQNPKGGYTQLHQQGAGKQNPMETQSVMNAEKSIEAGETFLQNNPKAVKSIVDQVTQRMNANKAYVNSQLVSAGQNPRYSDASTAGKIKIERDSNGLLKVTGGTAQPSQPSAPPAQQQPPAPPPTAPPASMPVIPGLMPQQPPPHPPPQTPQATIPSPKIPTAAPSTAPTDQSQSLFGRTNQPVAALPPSMTPTATLKPQLSADEIAKRNVDQDSAFLSRLSKFLNPGSEEWDRIQKQVEEDRQRKSAEASGQDFTD